MVTRIPAGELTLEAETQLRAGAPAAIVCHPHPAFGGRMNTPLVVALDDALAQSGLTTVRFNFRGIDGSEGVATGGRREHEDVAAVAAWVRAQGAAEVALVGYSFGALMAARAMADGLGPFAFAAVGLPTTLVGDDAERQAIVAAALEARVPSLFIAGDADQFCEVERIGGWIAGKPWARQEVLPGRGHFFAGQDEIEVCRRVAEFVRGQAREVAMRAAE